MFLTAGVGGDPAEGDRSADAEVGRHREQVQVRSQRHPRCVLSCLQGGRSQEGNPSVQVSALSRNV